MLHDLSCPSGQFLPLLFPAEIIVFHFDFLISGCLANSFQGQTSFLRLISSPSRNDHRIKHHHIDQAHIHDNNIFLHTDHICRHATHASRFACKVSSRSLPTERSACVAGSEGRPKKKISLTIYFTILLLLKLFLMFLEKLIKIPHIFQFVPFTTSVIVCVYIINLCIQRSKHKR